MCPLRFPPEVGKTVKKEEKAYSLSSQEKYAFDVLPFDAAVFMSTINVPILFFCFRFFFNQL